MAKKSAALVDERSGVITTPGEDPITRTWPKTHGTYITGRAYVDEADLTGSEMEAKWGVGRLRLLVGPELREKFDRQRYLFNQAIWHGDLEAVRLQAGRMVKAWIALDRTAGAVRGVSRLSPRVMEVGLSDGRVAAIVSDFEDARLVKPEGRKLVVYTLEEIAKLLELNQGVANIKLAFPGATVTAVRKPGDTLEAFSSSAPSLDDPFEDMEIPF